VGGEEEREVEGELEVPAAPEAEAEAVEESTEPAGLADLPPTTAPIAVLAPVLLALGAGALPTEGIRLPIIPLVSLTFRSPPTKPAVLGSSPGRRLPMSPPLTEVAAAGGPERPNGCVGTRGAAEGLLNFAILSLREPDTTRDWLPCGWDWDWGLDEGEEERDEGFGGVNDDGVDLAVSRNGWRGLTFG
jgi:hypothetical protein